MNLVAISPATKTVALGSAAVEVTGLSLRKLTQLIIAYPELVTLVGGGKLDVPSIIVKGPEMALAVFSLALVGPASPRFWQRMQAINDERILAAFDRASTGQQIGALGAIFDMTFKGGERAAPLLRSVVASLATSTQTSGNEPEPSIEPAAAAPPVETETETETSVETSQSPSSA